MRGTTKQKAAKRGTDWRAIEQAATAAAASIDKEAVKAASLVGVSDVDLLQRFPGLKGCTLRKWRERDAVWSAGFHAAKAARRSSSDEQRTERHELSQKIVTNAITDSLADIQSRNAVRIANGMDRSLAQVMDRKKPVTLRNVADVFTAYKLLRLATGEDSESAQVQLNLWGSPGINSAGIAPAFRDVSPAPVKVETQESVEGV